MGVKPIEAFISTALFCAGGLMMLPQNMPPTIPSPPPIPREAVYAVPPSITLGVPTNNTSSISNLPSWYRWDAEAVPVTACQMFVRDHQWKKTGLLMQTDYSAKTNQWDLRGYRPVFYCTNCGVLRIEVGK